MNELPTLQSRPFEVTLNTDEGGYGDLTLFGISLGQIVTSFRLDGTAGEAPSLQMGLDLTGVQFRTKSIAKIVANPEQLEVLAAMLIDRATEIREELAESE